MDDYKALVSEVVSLVINEFEENYYLDEYPSDETIETVIDEVVEAHICKYDRPTIIAKWLDRNSNVSLEMTLSETYSKALKDLKDDVFDIVQDDYEDYIRDIIWKNEKSIH